MIELSPELQLILACSWIAPSAAESDQRRRIENLCAGPIDWEEFLALVDRHQIISAVSNRLLKFVPNRVPSDVKLAIKERRLNSWNWTLMLSRELSSLNELFRERSIDLMPLKGPVLSSKLYRDPGFRSILDLDLLVRIEDLDQAHHLLLEHGYKRLIPSSVVTPKQLRILFAQCHHWVYRNVESEFSLELHWRIFRWSDAETKTLWDRSHTHQWLDAPVLSPENGMLLLSLCDHGSQHRYNRVKWLSDLAMLISSDCDWNWTDVIETALRLDLEMPLAQAVLLVDWLYEFEVPSELLEFAKNEPLAGRLALEALECLRDDDATPYSPKRELAGPKHLIYWIRRSARLAWYSTHLRKNVPLATRLRPVLIGVSDFDAFPLPDRFFWLYYPLRPVFWVCRCLRGR